jgi:nucleoside-diphosphate-sugar epimerase
MPPVSEGKVAIFGAGGPVGAAAARALRDQYTLRLTDVRPIAEIIAEGKPQSRGAPLPEMLPAPHESRVVDITDYGQVRDAAEGMDALINTSVVRSDLKLAFEVSLIGAYHIARAAVECGIRRVIHTGPFHTYLGHNTDYWWEFDVPDDVPLHPGSDLYAVSKYLGGEVMRVFAEQHGLEVLTFLFCGFLPASAPAWKKAGYGPFTVSWEDTGDAFLHGLRAPALPRPYEPFFITAPHPSGKYPPRKARRLLGWEARQGVG